MTIPATDRVRVIQPGQTYVGKQGFAYGAGASQTDGAERICMNVLPMPPGAQGKGHYHRGIETIAYLLEGECTVYYGTTLEQRAAVRAGDQIFIPADVPHAPGDGGGTPCTWLVVHSAGSDQDGIVLLPELDAVLPLQALSGTLNTGAAALGVSRIQLLRLAPNITCNSGDSDSDRRFESQSTQVALGDCDARPGLQVPLEGCGSLFVREFTTTLPHSREIRSRRFL